MFWRVEHLICPCCTCRLHEVRTWRVEVRHGTPGFQFYVVPNGHFWYQKVYDTWWNYRFFGVVDDLSLLFWGIINWPTLSGVEKVYPAALISIPTCWGWDGLNWICFRLVFKPFQGIILPESDVFRRSQVQLPRRRTRRRRVWISTWRLPATSTPTCCCCCEMRLRKKWLEDGTDGKRTAATRWPGGPTWRRSDPMRISEEKCGLCWWYSQLMLVKHAFPVVESSLLLVQKHSRFLLVEKSAHLCRLFFHFDISWYFMIFHDISTFFLMNIGMSFDHLIPSLPPPSSGAWGWTGRAFSGPHLCHPSPFCRCTTPSTRCDGCWV